MKRPTKVKIQVLDQDELVLAQNETLIGYYGMGYAHPMDAIREAAENLIRYLVHDGLRRPGA